MPPSASSVIALRGARTHNLKNIHLNLPRDQLIVITGLSGSGKSSLAFDTLYAEGQRRYVESLSAYARQFLSMMEKPDVDVVEGLSPAISIEQKSTSHNPRSTVGTITEVYDYLRLLYARAGKPRCPKHGDVLEAQTVSQMVDAILSLPEGVKVMLLAPVVRKRKGEQLKLLESLQDQGFIRARIDGEVMDLSQAPSLDLKKQHTIEVVVDRLRIREGMKERLAQSLEIALKLADGLASVAFMDPTSQKELLFSANLACRECGYSLIELEPRLFSFNNPMGACPTCDGLGTMRYFDADKVVENAKLSLAQGAIKGWGNTHPYHFQLLQSVAKHYGFAVRTSFARLAKKYQKIILFGSGQEKLTLRYVNYEGHCQTKYQPFEGVIPLLQRRYLETESPVVREDLAGYMTISPCAECQGSRLCLSSRHVLIEGKNIADVTQMSIENAYDFFQHLNLSGQRGKIAEKILKEVKVRLGFLCDVGLNYLTLSRSAETLSGGEAQRIRLASQIGSGLVGVMYILDEPSIGLHQRDNERLLKTLGHLRDLGNTVIVVEHDEEAILRADYVVDIGPGAGVHGGEVVAQGHPDVIKQVAHSLTGQYLSGQKTIAVPKQRLSRKLDKQLSIRKATCHNLKQIDVDIPLGLMTCVTGVSGSGKSSLINDTLYPFAARALNRAGQFQAKAVQSITGFEFLNKVIDINQSPIGRTPRSNPATYTGVFTDIRELFAATKEARARGYKPGRFSFNVRGGRCEACQGDGVMKVEMHFLADIYVTCDVCKGQRYNRETLEIRYKQKTIHDVLSMTVEQALVFFDAIPAIARRLKTLIHVGLSYITLGQNAVTLSGGEAQRVKLSKELSKRATGDTLYILDEPTTGLHFHDVQQLLHVLCELRDQGNTIVIIEHHLDVIKTADWIIDMGPEGGEGGGQVVAVGTPETLANTPHSYTGQFLKPVLSQSS